jgi:hypothetical protein
LRSNAMNTMTVPARSRIRPAISPGHLRDFINGVRNRLTK